MHKKMMALCALARAPGRSTGGAPGDRARAVQRRLLARRVRRPLPARISATRSGATSRRPRPELRAGEGLAWDVLDFDGDGNDEVWVHSAAFSALVSPRRGGAIEEYTLFASGINYANALTRRREAYHDLALERAAEHAGGAGGGTASIHDIEEGLRLDVAAAARRRRPRAVRRPGAAPRRYARGLCPRSYWAILSWARRRAASRSSGGGAGRGGVHRPRGSVAAGEADPVRTDGRDRGELDVGPGSGRAGRFFATELSLAGPVQLQGTPTPEEWRFEIETVAKSERGLDRTRQGESVTLRWPVELGARPPWSFGPWGAS